VLLGPTWCAFSAMKKKPTLRNRNWSEYNASLNQLGRLIIWVSSQSVVNWTADELTGEPGAFPTYFDLAIETMATVQAIYRVLSVRKAPCSVRARGGARD
jgi:Transposase DDE domain